MLSSFKPRVALYGNSCGFVDLRQDETKQAGWCIACLDCEDHSLLETDPDLVDLGPDAHAPLLDSKKDQLQDALGTKLWSKSVVDILMELFLARRDLQSNLEGKYQIYLGGLLKEFSEDEVMSFIGRIVSAHDPPHVPSDRSKKLSSHLQASLETIRNLVNRKKPGWLEKELAAAKLGKNKHPLASNFQQASEALAAGEEAIWSSHAANWVMMLAGDVGILANKLNIEQLAGRLRSVGDCEPTKFELYVMAAYQAAGVEIEKTDSNRTGEFRVIENGSYAYVECKQKTIDSVKERSVRDIYKQGTELLRDMMERYNSYAQVLITLSSDPEETDLKIILQAIEQEFLNHSDQIRRLRKGKNEILIVPSSSEQSGITTPKGYDCAVSSGKVQVNKEGQGIVENAWGVAWRSLTPTGWVSSALDSLRKAAKQLPKNSPGLVYLQVPFGPHEVVAGRMAVLASKMQPQLELRKGVNAVILIGQSLRTDPSSPNIAITSYRYQTIFQKDPRLPLPDGFKFFGCHYNRK
jgi:hypothetical protein